MGHLYCNFAHVLCVCGAVIITSLSVLYVCLSAFGGLQAVSDPYSEAPCLWLSVSAVGLSAGQTIS